MYDYHRANGGSWSLAHDIGAGPGFVAERLADSFKKVAVSEPSEEYYLIAVESLQRGKYQSEKYIMSSTKAEESWLDDHTVDFACMNCMIHWTDPKCALAAVAKSIKPGGTLSVTTVTRPRIVNNEAASVAWEALWDSWYDPSSQAYQEQMGSPMVQRGLELLQNWLDNIEFPSSSFKDVQRFHINGSNMSCSQAHPGRTVSAMGEDDVMMQLHEEENWSNEVDVSWLKALMVTYPKAHKMSESESSQPLWRKLQEAVQGAEKLKIYWPLGMVLATKA